MHEFRIVLLLLVAGFLTIHAAEGETEYSSTIPKYVNLLFLSTTVLVASLIRIIVLVSAFRFNTKNKQFYLIDRSRNLTFRFRLLPLRSYSASCGAPSPTTINSLDGFLQSSTWTPTTFSTYTLRL